MRQRVIDAPEDIWFGYTIIDEVYMHLNWRSAKTEEGDERYIRADLVKITRRKMKQSVHPPRIWLNYGDLDRDRTHAELSRDGAVGWSKDEVFDSDVMYIRADLVVERRKR